MNKIKSNNSSIWESIYSNQVLQSNEDLTNSINEYKQTEHWKKLTAHVTETLGGWANVSSVELGCGMGWHSLLAATEGANVTLVDYSNNALENAKKRFIELGLAGTFVNADVFEWAPVHKEQFNLSWSFGTVEHFREPLRQSYFDFHFDVLQKDGISIISAPYSYAINYRIWKFIAEYYNMWEFGLEIPYSKWELRKKLKNISCKEKEIFLMEGNPCLRKAIGILRRNSKILYFSIGKILTIISKANIKIYPFYLRDLILIATKS